MQPVSGAVQCGKKNRDTGPGNHLKKAQKGVRKGRKYGEGTHGFKKNEQVRLNKLFPSSKPVSGKTYESEHTIGYAVLVLGAKDMKRGKSSDARKVENSAPAYQEVRELHRSHIGTGTRGRDKKVGFSSGSYRDAQRRLLKAHDVSSGVQINQLGYAFDPNLRKSGFKDKVKVATNSFDLMVRSMKSVGFSGGGGGETAPVTPEQRVEMYLARRVILKGRFPTVEEENEARKLFGLEELTDTD